MDFQEIKTEDYSVQYDPKSVTFKFQGELSLGGQKEYGAIAKLLDDVANESPSKITLNLKELEFLNSSGISLLSKFVIGVPKKKTIQLSLLHTELLALALILKIFIILFLLVQVNQE